MCALFQFLDSRQVYPWVFGAIILFHTVEIFMRTLNKSKRRRRNKKVRYVRISWDNTLAIELVKTKEILQVEGYQELVNRLYQGLGIPANIKR